jgi:tetratricopeptide (TPR) repeat protein
MLYNGFFHFNPKALGGGRLKVRAYRDRQTYDAYIQERIDAASPGAVYLHYSQQPERRELVVHRGSTDEERMFSHQAFVQYLRAFVSYPPSWFREGFAIYFSSVRFDQGQARTGAPAAREGLVYEENLSWLEAVKALGAGAPSVESLLLSDVKKSQPDNFQGVSWALVSFLVEARNIQDSETVRDSRKTDYFRIICECFLLLKNAAALEDNAQTLYDHIRSWVDFPTIERDYKAYLAARKTFADLIAEGQRAYNEKDPKPAEESFKAAQKQRPNHYAPYYYLGLLSYDGKNYEQAEQYYRAAQQYGADPALIAYALGINAAASGRSSEAVRFLEQAKAASSTYSEQADTLIKQLR